MECSKCLDVSDRCVSFFRYYNCHLLEIAHQLGSSTGVFRYNANLYQTFKRSVDLLTPEDHTRQQIDLQLKDCGWIIQDMSNMNIMAGTGVAVREYQLTTGEADCGLYIDGKVAGGIEAKKDCLLYTSPSPRDS